VLTVAGRPGETLAEKIARLKDGTWHASERPAQVTGNVWRKAPGGVPVRTRRPAWRGRIFRHPPGGNRPEQDGCQHSHRTGNDTDQET
jgi:hypothetical protein